MQLLEELVASEVAARSGIDNTPPPWIISNLMTLPDGLEGIVSSASGAQIRDGMKAAARWAPVPRPSGRINQVKLSASVG